MRTAILVAALALAVPAAASAKQGPPPLAATWAPDAVGRFREAVGRDVSELTALGGITRLRELGVPEDDLADLAAAAAARPGNQANPRPAGPDEIEQLLRSVW